MSCCDFIFKLEELKKDFGLKIDKIIQNIEEEKKKDIISKIERRNKYKKN